MFQFQTGAIKSAEFAPDPTMPPIFQFQTGSIKSLSRKT